jgi:hypothetical protein
MELPNLPFTSPKAKLKTKLSKNETRATMHDIKCYYDNYAREKNLLNNCLFNATVTKVKRLIWNKSICKFIEDKGAAATNNNEDDDMVLWEVSGIIDRRNIIDKAKTNSLPHNGDIKVFQYLCKHLVLANGASDSHNRLNVKGEDTSKYILNSMKQFEEKIRDNLQRLMQMPLIVIGAGLSAADAILLARKYEIKIIHIMRRSVNDSELIFNRLPSKVYPEYHQVYTSMRKYQYNKINKELTTSLNCDINNNNYNQNYVLYDEHEVKRFYRNKIIINKINGNNEGELLISFSYACVLIGYSADLSFLPQTIINRLTNEPSKRVDSQENPIHIDPITHEVVKCKNLYAMGPLIGDNFVRFGTGGALAITSALWKQRQQMDNN